MERQSCDGAGARRKRPESRDHFVWPIGPPACETNHGNGSTATVRVGHDIELLKTGRASAFLGKSHIEPLHELRDEQAVEVLAAVGRRIAIDVSRADEVACRHGRRRR